MTLTAQGSIFPKQRFPGIETTVDRRLRRGRCVQTDNTAEIEYSQNPAKQPGSHDKSSTKDSNPILIEAGAIKTEHTSFTTNTSSLLH